MYKVTDINFGNPKQKGDGSSGGIKCESTKSANTILSKISTSSDIMNSHQHAEQTLQDQVSSFYNTIKPSQPKELTTDLYKLPSYTESQCKTSKIQYKGNNANMNTERFHQFGGCSSLLNEKSVNRITETNCDDEIDDDNYISDSETTDSDFSNLSGLSDLSGQEWKPITKPLTWVQKQMHSGVNPRDILSQILSNGTTIAPNMNDLSLWRILASMLSEPPRRQKLKHINTIEDVVGLLEKSNNIIVLTGAGVSVSCGIPDFRSSDGIYSRLAKDFPDLPDPQAMFDINYFSRDPRPFYKFAREIYPGQFVPSPCHRFIKLLEKKQKLLRNYTQNIDTLEQVAGIKNVIECHGSFATASCTRCKYKTTADVIRGDIFEQRIPLCPKCQPDNDVDIKGSILSYSDLVQRGIMKPDIVFFGEGLPDVFHSAMASDKDKCDLLIVIGSSLKVRPVALIPSSIPADVPQILINREQLSHLEFDVELLGDSDIIINQLCKLLGGEDWLEICWNSNVLHQTKQLKFEPAAQKDDAKSSNLHSSSIDTDSQSIITTNSSNGGFFDSGFESTSSTDILRCSNNKESRFNMTNIDQLRPSCSSSSQDQQILKDSATMNCDAESNSLLLDLPDHTNVVKFQKNTNVRHMSVDSSKDSGICDLSSSNFVPLSSTSTTCTNSSHIVEEDEEDDDDVTERNNVHELENDIIYHERSHEKISTSCNEDYLWLNNKSTVRSAGERLFDNTYYYHPSTCSYVFPGAQVYFNSDEENDDDADDDNDDVDHSSNKKELVVDDSTTNNESNNGGGGENRNDIIINCESDSDSPPNKKRKDHN